MLNKHAFCVLSFSESRERILAMIMVKALLFLEPFKSAVSVKPLLTQCWLCTC